MTGCLQLKCDDYVSFSLCACPSVLVSLGDYKKNGNKRLNFNTIANKTMLNHNNDAILIDGCIARKTRQMYTTNGMSAHTRLAGLKNMLSMLSIYWHHCRRKINDANKHHHRDDDKWSVPIALQFIRVFGRYNQRYSVRQTPYNNKRHLYFCKRVRVSKFNSFRRLSVWKICVSLAVTRSAIEQVAAIHYSPFKPASNSFAKWKCIICSPPCVWL